MALPPKFGGQLLPAAVAESRHTIELYLDYVCPFSAKMFNTVYTSVAPIISKKYSSRVQVIFRQQIQPWHPSSTLVHEAGAAVLKVAPTKFWAFSAALFKAQQEFFDVNVVNEKRNDTYKRLAGIAAKEGIEEKKILDLLVVSDKPGSDGSLNIGNGVTNDIKQLVKVRVKMPSSTSFQEDDSRAQFNRRLGVHVTPTVLFNGIEEGSISSSFTAEQWEEWLDKNVV